jgi:hypothetical protein
MAGMPFKLILTDAAHFFWDNLGQIVTLCAPFLIAGAVFNDLLLSHVNSASDSGSVYLLSLALNFVLYPIYTIALILLMARRAQQERPTNAQLISEALSRYGQFLLLSIIGMGLVWCGFLLFIIPGIWLAVRLSFAEFFLLIDRLDPREALIQSFQTTRRYFWGILMALALFALPIFILAIGVDNLLQAAHAGPALNIIADAGISFLSLFMHVVLFRIFMQVRYDAGLNPGAV